MNIKILEAPQMYPIPIAFMVFAAAPQFQFL